MKKPLVRVAGIAVMALMTGMMALSMPVEAKPAHAKGNPQAKHQPVKLHARAESWQESNRYLAKKDHKKKHQHRDHDRHRDRDHRWQESRRDWNDRNWNDRDRDRLRDWLSQSYNRRYDYRGNVSNSVLRRYGISRAEFYSLPPGIQQRLMSGKPLPPGQARKLAAGYRMNGDLLGRVNPVSDGILGGLGIPRDRYYYNDGRRVGRYGNDAVIYNPNSGIVFDVLSGIFN